jgi:hypothetical protein
MSTVDETTDQAIEAPANAEAPASAEAAAVAGREPTIPIELRLDEAEALRAWLLKPAADGATSLDDPLVSRVLARLGAEVDAARATVGIRSELQHVGVSVEHLSDEEIRILARRIAEAGSAAIRG